MKFIFDSHGGCGELNARTGKLVEVLRALTEEEADIGDVGRMFRVRFEDGYEADVFTDELALHDCDDTAALATEQTLFTEEQWQYFCSRLKRNTDVATKWFAVTRWAAEDAIAAAEGQGVTMTVEQAEAWWARNESRFQNLLVERGNEILSEMDFEEGDDE